MNLKVERIQNLMLKALRAVPEAVIKPRNLVAASRGVHWATLTMLDHPWIRTIQFQTVLDVGANNGQFATASRALFPAAHIYSFEPLEECFINLTAQMSNDPRFIAFNFALGDSDAVTSFFRSSFSEASSILPMGKVHKDAFPWSDVGERVSVNVRTLDSIANDLEIRNPCLLKIDVQGYESAVLKGGLETLRKVNMAIIETSFVELYEGESTFHSIYETMTQQGFRFGGLLDQLRHPRTGAILQGDAVFLREGSGILA